MKKLLNLGLALAVMLVPAVAAAQNFDGSKPLVCATLETQDCELGGECIKGLARDIDAPQFIHLDFEKGQARTIRSEGDERTASIERVKLADSGALALQGVQFDRAWSATINGDSGELILVVAGDGVAFVVFGACTPM